MSLRPTVMGTRGVVSSGHHLATGIGIEILGRGGNAFDAAAGVGFALAVLQPHQNGIGGEAPIVAWVAREGAARAVSGHGTAPRAATLEYYRSLGLKVIAGDGFLPALVPPAAATWILLLRRFGKMKLKDVLEPAIRLAGDGFPMYRTLRDAIAGMAPRFRDEWPSSAAVFLRDGEPRLVGRLFRQPDLAATFQKLLEAEAGARDRDAGFTAAHERFYRGDIARAIVSFSRATRVKDATGTIQAGLLDERDLGEFSAAVEEPVRTSYREYEVLKCGPWTQGPAMLQALNILGGFDLKAMGHNSASYVHTVTEAMKLAYADREFQYGDPKFAAVPLGRLLSREYARERRDLIDPKAASLELRPGGRARVQAESVSDVDATFGSAAVRHGDTTKLEVMDDAGNAVSATPSGGWLMSSPVIPGLGFPLGTRGQMFSLAPGHPNCLAPGKRPRTTLTPSLALKDGKPYLSFGSPGGDAQDQWGLQFFLNVVEFGMELQDAVEAPTFTSCHWPSSFYPRRAEPGVLHVEDRVPEAVRDELRGLGHRIVASPGWSEGNTMAAGFDPKTGIFSGAASPRYEPAYAQAR